MFLTVVLIMHCHRNQNYGTSSMYIQDLTSVSLLRLHHMHEIGLIGFDLYIYRSQRAPMPNSGTYIGWDDDIYNTNH